MKNTVSKKAVIITTVVLLLTLFGCGTSQKEEENGPENVFEEIYLDRQGMWYMSERIPHFEHFFEQRYHKPSSKDYFRYYLNDQELRVLSDYNDIFTKDYPYEYFEENHSVEIITVESDFDNQTIMFIHQMIHPDRSVTKNVYSYSVETKLLTYETNDPNQTERDTFLFDLIVHDWLYYNDPVLELSYPTHFDENNLGSYDVDWE